MSPSQRKRSIGAGGTEFVEYDDDAALARALQEEYEREYRRRSLQQHLGSTAPAAVPSAPPASFATEQDRVYATEDDHVFASEEPFYSGTRRGTPAYDFAAFGPDETYQDIEVSSDEAYARRVEQEMVEEALRRQIELQEEEGRLLATERGAATAGRATVPSRTNSNRRKKPPSRSASSERIAPSRDSSFQQQQQQRQNSRKPPSRSNSLNNSHHNRNQPSSRSNSQRNLSRANSQRSSRDPPSRSSSRDRLAREGSSHRNLFREHSQRSLSRSNSRRNMGAATPAVVAAPFDLQLLSDEELAKRLEREELERMDQEDRDAELARQWIVEEQIRRSNAEAQRLQQQQQRQQSKCMTCRRMFSCIVALLVIAAAAVLLMVFLGGADEIGDFIPDPQGFRDEDPFNNANPDDANLWRTGGQGLKLTVINALESHWHEFFNKAVSEWDGGTPDALTLTVQTEDPQSVCRAQNGVLKVCNGNYGDTNWRGINKVLLENGWIYSSAARMNEYYLTRNYEKDFPQMAYTMCHEIGHGFGLPHTDENFFNADLGNCMDYTNRPENNMQPDTPNFNFLAQLYGTVDGSPVPDPEDTGGNEAVQTAEAVNGNGKNDGNRRRLRKAVPESVVAAFDDVDRLVDSAFIGTDEGNSWRKLHESKYAEAHEIDVGHGFKVQIHMLKFVPPQN